MANFASGNSRLALMELSKLDVKDWNKRYLKVYHMNTAACYYTLADYDGAEARLNKLAPSLQDEDEYKVCLFNTHFLRGHLEKDKKRKLTIFQEALTTMDRLY